MQVQDLDLTFLGLRVLEDAPVILLVLDMEGRISYFNRFFEDLSGYPLAEVRGADWFETFIPDRDRRQIRAIYGESAGGKHVRGNINPIRTRSGEEREIEWSDQALLDEQGEQYGVLAIGQDFTERELAERRLRANEVRLQKLIESTPVGVAMLDRELRYIACSRRWRADFGLGDRALAGVGHLEIFPQIPAHWRARYRRALAGESLCGDIERVERGGGQVHFFRWAIEPWKGASGQVGGIILFSEDITEQRRNEERLSEAQAVARLGSWEANWQSGEGWWSTELRRLMDLGTSQVPSLEGFEARVHPEDRHLIQASVEEAVARRSDHELIFRVLGQGEEVLTVLGKVQVDCDITGEPLWLKGTVQDISDQIEERRRLRNILDGVLAFVALFALDGTLLECNRGPLEAAGLRRDEVIGRPFWETWWWSWSKQSQAQLKDGLARAARGEQVQMELQARMADDHYRMLNARFGPILDAQGKVEGVVGSGLDITERLAAEATARERAEQLQLALDAGGLGTWGMDLRTMEVHYSPEIARTMGRIEEDFRSGVLADYQPELSPDDYELHLRTIGEYLRGERDAHRLEFRARAADGSWKWLESIGKAVGFDEEGRPTRVIGTLGDIDERKAAEMAQAASLREKETLLREVHHRVKNNLQVVSSLITLQARKATTPPQQELLEELRQRISAMTLVHDRLFRSQDISRVDFDDYTVSLVGEVRNSFPERREVALFVSADSVQLPIEIALPAGMILSELLTNALKYAFPGRGGRCEVRLTRAPGRAVLEVEDDGVGPSEGIDLSTDGGFGWELIRMLALQLGAEVTVVSDGGLKVRVDFPDT